MQKKRGSMRRRRRSKRYRTRNSLSASNLGPILSIFGVILGIAATVFLLVFLVLPQVLPFFGIDFSVSLGPQPTPTPTPVPTPTPHPMETYDTVAAQQELVFTDYTSYRWFGDPYFYGGKLLVSGGKLVDGNAVLGTLLLYNPETREAEVLNYPLQNTHYLFAKCNDRWLVYLDANLSGGGYIMAVNRTSANAQPVVVKKVYTGQPEIMLWDNYIAWTDRTGTKMDKLFVCDLSTMESTTLVMFSNSVYGQSLPSFRNGLLTWADSGNGNNSLIHSMRLGVSTATTYDPGTYVHDPESNGVYTAWLNGHHDAGCGLYYCKNNGTAMRIDSGVVEFGLGDGFIAYSKDQAIYVYIFDNEKTYRLSQEHESAMLLGVSDGKVIWMDVTSRERDILKFAEIPT